MRGWLFVALALLPALLHWPAPAESQAWPSNLSLYNVTLLQNGTALLLGDNWNCSRYMYARLSQIQEYNISSGAVVQTMNTRQHLTNVTFFPGTTDGISGYPRSNDWIALLNFTTSAGRKGQVYTVVPNYNSGSPQQLRIAIEGDYWPFMDLRNGLRVTVMMRSSQPLAAPLQRTVSSSSGYPFNTFGFPGTKTMYQYGSGRVLTFNSYFGPPFSTSSTSDNVTTDYSLSGFGDFQPPSGNGQSLHVPVWLIAQSGNPTDVNTPSYVYNASDPRLALNLQQYCPQGLARMDMTVPAVPLVVNMTNFTTSAGTDNTTVGASSTGSISAVSSTASDAPMSSTAGEVASSSTAPAPVSSSTGQSDTGDPVGLPPDSGSSSGSASGIDTLSSSSSAAEGTDSSTAATADSSTAAPVPTVSSSTASQDVVLTPPIHSNSSIWVSTPFIVMYACVGALVLVGAVVGVRKPEKKVDSHSDSEPEEAETSASWHAGSEQPELMFFPRKTRYVRVKGAV